MGKFYLKSQKTRQVAKEAKDYFLHGNLSDVLSPPALIFSLYITLALLKAITHIFVKLILSIRLKEMVRGSEMEEYTIQIKVCVHT